jgi:hypothetical protein
MTKIFTLQKDLLLPIVQVFIILSYRCDDEMLGEGTFKQFFIFLPHIAQSKWLQADIHLITQEIRDRFLCAAGEKPTVTTALVAFYGKHILCEKKFQSKFLLPKEQR